MFLKKTLKILAVSLLLIIALSTIWWFWPERTPGIRSEGTSSISTIDYINIGATEQCVLIRSENTDNPIMLFLHGGPGMPMMYLAHEFQRPLEEHFTVVQWDRRGAGKTYSRNVPTPESMNTRQLLNDAYQLIDTLRSRYGKNKIILAGHSFGTHLGSIMVHERPELFAAYISIGQVVDDDRAAVLQKEFIRSQAEEQGKDEIIQALNNNEIKYYEDLLFEFGGELKNRKSFFPLIWSGLQAPEYTLPEAISLGNASSFSSFHMKYNVLSQSIYDEIIEYQVPVYFFAGVSDYTTPHELITEYFEMVKAPRKQIIYFENSAHFPFFEEPEEFCKEINRIFRAEN